MRPFVFIFCLLGASGHGRELTLDQAVEQALAGNRDFSVYTFEVEKAQGRAVQSSLPRNPELEIGARSDVLFKNEGERGITLGISQAFPRKDRLRKARDAANLSVEQQQALVRDAERRLIGEVQSLFLKVLMLDRHHAARQQMVDNSGKLAVVIEQRYRAGEVPQTDIAPIQIENVKLRQEQDLLLTEKADTELKLKQVIGLPADEPLTLAGNLDAIVARWASAGAPAASPEQRPDFAAARIATAQADAEIVAAKAAAYDDITVGVDYEGERAVFEAPLGVKYDHYLGFKVSIPLANRNKNQGRILEQQAVRRQAVAEVDAVRQRAIAEVTQARTAAERLGPVLTRYRAELIPLAESHFQAVQRAYQQGQEGILPVFQAQQQRFSLEVDYLTQLARQIDALITVETASGAHPHVRNHPSNSPHPHTPSQP